MTINEQFFDLIRVALGRAVCLSHSPTASEWGELYAMAKKQSLVGVCFAGVQKLVGQQQEPPEMLYLTWMGMAAKIQQCNEIVNRQCVELQAKLSDDGMRSAILKGQGVGQLYGSLAGLRQSGDIDVWVPGGAQALMAYARAKYGEVSYDYINAHLPVYQDTEVELHWRVQSMNNLLKNNRLQKWLKEHEEDVLGGKAVMANGESLTVPTSAFNRFYILLHAFNHVMSSGLGLRQLMDYYFVLKVFSSSCDATERVRADAELVKLFRSFGMMRFARSVMWLLAHVFEDMSSDKSWAFCEPLESEGRFLLNEVMAGGNFGHHDERIKNTGLKGVWGEKSTQLQHVFLVARHYPSEIFWTPVWIIYHKLWKWLGRH